LCSSAKLIPMPEGCPGTECQPACASHAASILHEMDLNIALRSTAGSTNLCLSVSHGAVEIIGFLDDDYKLGTPYKLKIAAGKGMIHVWYQTAMVRIYGRGQGGAGQGRAVCVCAAHALAALQFRFLPHYVEGTCVRALGLQEVCQAAQISWDRLLCSCRLPSQAHRTSLDKVTHQKAL
jgi:hypothetical protein